VPHTSATLTTGGIKGGMTVEMHTTRIVGGLVLTLDDAAGTVADGEVEITGDRITYVGPRRAISAEDRIEVLDATGAIVMPGLVNAHLHSYGVFAKGSVDALPLDLFVPHVMPLGEALSDEDLYLAAALTAAESLRNGTTCLMDHLRFPYDRTLGAVEAAVRGYLDAGIRATVAPMFGDRTFADSLPQVDDPAARMLPSAAPADADAYLEACAQAVSRFHGAAGRIQIFLGTDGPQRCTLHLLEQSREFLETYPVGMQSHVFETASQRVRGMQLYGRSLVTLLADHGLLGPRLSLVHFVWSDAEDHARVKQSGAAVVHCPAANLQIGSGIAPVPEMLSVGIPIALGSDGANVLDLSVWTQARLAALLHRVAHPWYPAWVTSADVIQMATAGGATVHGLRDEIGILRPGARADVILLDGHGPALAPTADPVTTLVARETGSSVQTVLVGGEVTVRDGRCTRIDEAVLMSRLNQRWHEIQPFVQRQQQEMLTAYGGYVKAMYRRVMSDLDAHARFSRPSSEWPTTIPTD